MRGKRLIGIVMLAALLGSVIIAIGGLIIGATTQAAPATQVAAVAVDTATAHTVGASP